MRTLSRLRTLTMTSAAAVAAVGLLGSARTAHAQTVLPVSNNTPIGAVRGGVYFPFNSTAKDEIGKTLYGGGLDYFVQRSGPSRTNISLDYIERSSGGNDLRIIPLTVSEFNEQLGSNGVHPYAGFGVGAYFVHVKAPDNFDNEMTRNATALGGFVAAGLDLPSNLLIEARYHIIEKEGGINPSGLQVMAGFRF